MAEGRESIGRRKWISPADPSVVAERMMVKERMMSVAAFEGELYAFILATRRFYRCGGFPEINRDVTAESEVQDAPEKQDEFESARLDFEIAERELRLAFLRLRLGILRSERLLLPARRREFIRERLVRMFGEGEESEAVRSALGRDVSQVEPASVLAAVLDMEGSSFVLAAGAERNLEDFSLQREEFAGFAERCKEEFREAVKHAVADGTLPGAALVNLHKIDSVGIVLADRLNPADVTTRHSGSHQANVIRIYSDDFVPQRLAQVRKILFHELLHDISGSAVRLAEPRGERPTNGQGGIGLRLREERSGLKLRPSAESGHAPFRWLNEAITEYLTLELSGYREEERGEVDAGYVPERATLERLISSGLSRDLVLRAYFENLDAPEPGEKAGARFGELVREIDALEGQRGFARLENGFLMREVEHILSEGNFVPSEQWEATFPERPAGLVTRDIEVSVGFAPGTVHIRRFTHIAPVLPSIGGASSPDVQWRDDHRVVDTARRLASKVRIREL